MLTLLCFPPQQPVCFHVLGWVYCIWQQLHLQCAEPGLQRSLWRSVTMWARAPHTVRSNRIKKLWEDLDHATREQEV